jgi:hypothetical protein
MCLAPKYLKCHTFPFFHCHRHHLLPCRRPPQFVPDGEPPSNSSQLQPFLPSLNPFEASPPPFLLFSQVFGGAPSIRRRPCEERRIIEPRSLLITLWWASLPSQHAVHAFPFPSAAPRRRCAAHWLCHGCRAWPCRASGHGFSLTRLGSTHPPGPLVSGSGGPRVEQICCFLLFCRSENL